MNIKFDNTAKVLPVYGSFKDSLELAVTRGEDLSYVILEKVKMKGFSLRNAKLHHAKFTGSKINWTFFVGADLRYADFTNCDLRGCVFMGADLSHAKFTNADLRHVDLSFTICDYTNFKNVILSEDDVLMGAVLEKAKFAEALKKKNKPYHDPDLRASLKDLVGKRCG